MSFANVYHNITHFRYSGGAAWKILLIIFVTSVTLYDLIWLKNGMLFSVMT